nr:hypothetical protein [Streptococcus cristatus]
MVEHIGNKIPFEKRLNIIASNGYFVKKKESYRKSKVGILLEITAIGDLMKLENVIFVFLIN